MTRPLLLALLLASVALAGCSGSRTTTRPTAQPQAVDATSPPAQRASARRGGTDGPKPYADVITDAAASDDGLFTVHQLDGKLFYEIPDSLLGEEMLWISRIAQTPPDFSPFISGGSKSNEQVVRWERQRDRVLLRTVSYNAVAAESLAVFQAVRNNNFEPILAAFDIATIGPDSNTVVIDVTDLFTTDVPAISGIPSFMRRQYQVRRLDGARSYLEGARSFPLNVEVRHVQTFDAQEAPSNAETNTISLLMNQSMVLLPREPMTPRLDDPRVGYFTVRQIDFGSEAQKADTKTYIRRWNLIPSDWDAYFAGALVEPEKPIVYYLDPGTPEKWRPYIKQGVEDWNKAFEAAGFRNAIQAKDAPDDPDWHPEDVRYSTVRWVANTTRNAMGPSVSDPRTGEIIESDIIWYHNHLRSYRNRLLIETGASNPAARSLDLPDAIIGETMRQVIAHEIGHAIGLPHNWIASNAYPVDSLRSVAFTNTYGLTPSIMEYARQNYIAQPGDGPVRYVRMLGPYDLYSVEWGYRRFPGVDSPQEEAPLLDAMILEHADDPWYRFGSPGTDPRTQTEDLGDDAVQASTYAIANLRRVVPNLIEWTSTPGEDYSDLAEIYGETVGMWSRYVGHVADWVGGVYETRRATDEPAPVFEVVPEARQREAMDWMIANVFDTPTWLLEKAILDRIQGTGALDRIRSLQARFLNQMLDPQVMQRLVEAETFEPGDTYTLLEMLADVRGGVWTELDARRPEIDTYRRALQRAYIERMAYLMTEELTIPSRFQQTPVDVSQSDIRAFVRGELEALHTAVRRAQSRANERATRYHLTDVLARIDAVLNPAD